jgi:hypothetical protein
MDISNLEINQSDLSGELATNASKFAYVSERFVQALGEYDKAQVELDRQYAQLDSQIRENAQAEGKKLTERLIENEIKLNENYSHFQSKLLTARTKKELLKSLRDAWSTRSDSLMKLVSVSKDEHSKTISLSAYSK